MHKNECSSFLKFKSDAPTGLAKRAHIAPLAELLFTIVCRSEIVRTVQFCKKSL